MYIYTHIIYAGDVTVLCNQTGVTLTVKVSKLSSEEEEIRDTHLRYGSQLLLDENGHHYPVTVYTAESSCKKQRRDDSESEVVRELNKNLIKWHLLHLGHIQSLPLREY